MNIKINIKNPVLFVITILSALAFIADIIWMDGVTPTWIVLLWMLVLLLQQIEPIE